MKKTCFRLICFVFAVLLLWADGVRIRAAESVDGMEDASAAESVGGMEDASAAENGDDADDTSAEENDIYNILLIGTDRRDDSWNGNSDVIIVASINAETQRISLISFMRDLYAEIPGYGVHKINYAYAAGGADTLKDTLLSNYDVEIDNYAVVDFDEMAEIVDMVDGVEITVSDAEAEVLNGYLVSMNAAESPLPGAGTYRLNGDQAVAYMRIRYVGNNDYERTQRQRTVLREIFDSVRVLDAERLAAMSGRLLTLVEHDFSILDLMKLTGNLSEYITYSLAEARVPFDGLYYSQNEMLVPDFEVTKEKLYEIMEEGAEP